MSDDDRPALPAVERVNQTTFLAITWTAVWVAFSLVAFRLFTRIKSVKKLLSDDYLVILAWLIFLVSSVLWQLKIGALYWMYDIQSGKALPTPEFQVLYGGFLPTVLAWDTLFYSCLWSVKFSLLMFFRRLGANVSLGRIWWWVVFVFTVVGLVACLIAMDYACTLSDITFIQVNCGLIPYANKEGQLLYSTTAIDIATDLLILSIPFRILWNVRIARKRKVLLLGIFSLTIIIIIIAVIRVLLVKGLNNEAQSPSIDWLYFWSNIEAGAAICVACLASFRTLFVFKHNQRNNSASTESSLQRLARRFHFTRLSPDQYENGHSYEYWMECPPAADSQHPIVPLNSVHVSRSVDVTIDEVTPEVQNRINAQNRGYDFG